MNLLQRMGSFGSKVNIFAQSAKVYSARKKVVAGLKSIIPDNEGIDFGESLKHYNAIPAIVPGFVNSTSRYYADNLYGKLLASFKKYRAGVEDLILGTGRKFARKTDERIDKATLKNNTEDVKAFETDKQAVGEVLMDFIDDYNYYLKVFENLNFQFGIKQDEGLSLN